MTEAEHLVWTDGQVAERLQVTAETVRNLHKQNLLPGVHIGQSLRWRPADVLAYLSGLTPGVKPRPKGAGSAT